MALEQDFRSKVRDAIQARDGEPLLYSSIDHNAILMSEAFNAATESVKILSKDLDVAAYMQSEVLNRARAFLCSHNHKLRILVESRGRMEWLRHPFVESLKDFMEGPNPRLEVREVSPDMVQRYKYNFFILDDYGYQFKRNRDMSGGIAGYESEADRRGAIKISNIFADIWNQSKPLVPSVPATGRRPAADAAPNAG